MKKIYISLSLFITLVIIWFGGYISLLGFDIVISSLFRDTLLIAILYFIVIELNMIKLYRKAGIRLVEEFLKERKKYQEKYYKGNERKVKNKLPLLIIYLIFGITGTFACFLLERSWGILFFIFFIGGGVVLIKNNKR